MKDDDEITRFFKSITPEDFIANVVDATLAEGGRVGTSFYSRPIPSTGTFETFLGEHMAVLRIAFASCDGEIYPIAAVAAGDQVYYFKGDDGEILREFTGRIRHFAALALAKWMFVYKKVDTQVGGEDFTAVYWVAGQRLEREVAYRHGYFEVGPDGQVLGDCFESNDGSRPESFTDILDDAR